MAHQRPPRGFASRTLVLSHVNPGDVWWRLYASKHANPLGFGFGPSRFSDPQMSLVPPERYGVVYLGSSVKVCFAETILRDRGAARLRMPPLEWAAISAWICAEIHVGETLTLVDLRGDGPLRMGVPTDVARARSHGLARQWSCAFWSHDTKPDGIIYASRLNGETNIAVFDRALTKVRGATTTPLVERRSDLAAIIQDFNLAIV